MAKPGERIRRGYWAPCINCGRTVVHARSTNEPFHMHRWSKRCEEDGAALRDPASPAITDHERGKR